MKGRLLRWRLATAGIVGGLALAPLAPLSADTPPAPVQTAGSSAVPTISQPVQVELTRLTPAAPQPGDTLVLRGTLRNVSSESVATLAVQLWLGADKITTRGALDSFADDPTGSLVGLSPVGAPISAARPSLGPGGSERFRLAVPVNQLNLPDTWEVRELGVDVTGSTALGVTTVGSLRSFLPWAPRGAIGHGVPTRVAWLWPLIDQPHRTAGSTWTDDDLAAAFGADGRLTRLVSAAVSAATQHSVRHPRRTRTVPVTWAIDPMLVDDASAMTKPYQVSADGNTRSGAGGAAARQWLASLRTAVAEPGTDLLPLPYADPDLDAAIRAGFGAEVGAAATSGRTLLEHALTPNNWFDAAWPPGGYIDQRTADELFATGVTTVVLADGALPPVTPPNATPTARTVLRTDNGDLSVLLSDSTLDQAVASGADDPSESAAALQRYLAETLMIQNELPNDQRSVVIAPERRWAPTASYAQALLADTGKVPWIRPVSLSQVAAEPADTQLARASLTVPPTARHAELGAGYLHGLDDAARHVTTLGALAPGAATVRDLTTGIQRGLSSAWRTAPFLASDRLDALHRAIDTAMGRVRIASQPNSFVTLTSHNGNVPVTIANDLDSPVRVRLELNANQRLTLGRTAGQIYTITPHHPRTIDVHAAAKTSGVFPLQVRLLTPKGGRYGAPVQLFVRSTVYGTITLAITGAATGALLLAVAVRLIRRARRARRTPATP